MKQNTLPAKQKLDLYTYVSINNPIGTKELAEKEGYKFVPKNAMQGAMILSDIAYNDKEQGLMKIAMIHPDRELILKSANNTNKNMSDAQANFLNAESSVNQTVDNKKGISEKTMNLLIISGSVILGITLITIIATSKK